MNTFRYFADPNLVGVYWPVVVTGLAVAMLCALLSVLVVLKRLAFIGQGISHAGFGGMGLAAVMGLAFLNIQANRLSRQAAMPGMRMLGITVARARKKVVSIILKTIL